MVQSSVNKDTIHNDLVLFCDDSAYIDSVCYKIYFNQDLDTFYVLGNYIGGNTNKYEYLGWRGTVEECKLWLEISKAIWNVDKS